MEEELLEYYSNIFIASRSEERYIPMIRILFNVLELGYGERYLTKIYNMEIDDCNTHVDAVERLVLDCFVTEMQRLGIEIDEVVAYQRPSAASYLLSAILEDIENHEDPDRLYQMIASEDAGVFEIEEMVREINNNADIELTDLIISMSPRILPMFRNVLETSILDANEVEEDDGGFARKIALYLKHYPQNPESTVFYNLDKDANFEPLCDELRYDLDGYDNLELVIIYTVGIALLYSNTYEEAYGKAHEIYERIAPDDDVNVYHVLGKANEALFSIYEAYSFIEGEDDEDEQTRIPD